MPPNVHLLTHSVARTGGRSCRLWRETDGRHAQPYQRRSGALRRKRDGVRGHLGGGGSSSETRRRGKRTTASFGPPPSRRPAVAAAMAPRVRVRDASLWASAGSAPKAERSSETGAARPESSLIATCVAAAGSLYGSQALSPLPSRPQPCTAPSPRLRSPLPRAMPVPSSLGGSEMQRSARQEG